MISLAPPFWLFQAVVFVILGLSDPILSLKVLDENISDTIHRLKSEKVSIGERKGFPPEFTAKTYIRPESPLATIEYDLSRQMRVQVYVYDITRSFSEELVDKVHEPGKYREYFDGSDRKSGLYICKILAGTETWIEPLLLIK